MTFLKNFIADSMQHPEMDPRWGFDEKIFDYQSFRQKINLDFFLKKNVPDEIKGYWNVIKSLVELSYYQYEFIDLAVHKAFISLELAMKLRYREIKNDGWEYNQTMNPLIKWFYKRGYFETDHIDYIDKIISIRNHYSHPKTHSFGGPFTAHNLYSPLHLINDLYEDLNLRKERNRMNKDLQVVFDSINRYGGQVNLPDGNTQIIYLISTSFINNKNTPTITHLNYHVQFNIPSHQKGDSCLIYSAKLLDCFDVNMSETSVIGKLDNEGSTVKISLISDSTLQKEFNLWKTKYNEFASATMHNHAVSSPLYSRGFNLISEFYKQDD